MDNKQAIQGFAEFFKGITGNQNLEIPSEIAEKYGIQTQADGEYISKESVIDIIEDVCPIYGNDYRYILREKVNELPSVAIPSVEPKWILCSERLPEENGRYLCTVGTDYRNPREMYYEPKGKNNRTWASLDRAYVEDCFVTAWMPLPEPYKAESEVEKNDEI